MKTLIIPDIHNRVDTAEQVLYHETPDKVVWLGDWFDDFGDNPDIAAKTASWLVARMTRNKDDVFIWGNHDVCYGFPSNESWCSGYEEGKKIAIRDIVPPECWDRFVLTHWHGKWLCSHAGLTKPHTSGIKDIRGWLADEEKSAQLAIRSGKRHWMTSAGMSRGGRAAAGGVTWADLDEFAPIPSISQIFGHTPQRQPWKYDTNRRAGKVVDSDNYCIDTHSQHYIVATEDEVVIKPTAVLAPLTK